MITLIIARHGNTFEPDEEPRRVGRRTDLPLVAKGREQAAALGRYLKVQNLLPDEVYCSTLRRTRETAEIAMNAAEHPVTITTLTIFDEIDYGQDENKPESDVIARLGKEALDLWDQQDIPPADWPVNTQEIKNNWKVFINNISDNATEKHKIVLVLTSNGIARFALYHTSRTANISHNTTHKLATGNIGILKISKDFCTVKAWNQKPA